MPIQTEEPPPVAAERPPFGPRDASLEAPVLTITRLFVRQYWLAMASISAFLLIPCFWHRYIVAGDLDSHMYNAWLVQLIERVQAPGLWIAHQWNNILFDLLLSNLGNFVGLQAAERIAV